MAPLLESHQIHTCTAKLLRLVERTPTELASPPGAVFAEAPFQDGYDLTIGTSERGSDVASAQLPSFRWVQPRAGPGDREWSGAGDQSGGGKAVQTGLLPHVGCFQSGLSKQSVIAPPSPPRSLWVPGMLSWCSGASRGWKLEWMLTPT